MKLPDLSPHTAGFTKSAVAWHQAIILIGKAELKVPPNTICAGHRSLSQKDLSTGPSSLFWPHLRLLRTGQWWTQGWAPCDCLFAVHVHQTCITAVLICQTVFWSPGPSLNLFTHNRQKQVWVKVTNHCMEQGWNAYCNHHVEVCLSESVIRTKGKKLICLYPSVKHLLIFHTPPKKKLNRNKMKPSLVQFFFLHVPGLRRFWSGVRFPTAKWSPSLCLCCQKWNCAALFRKIRKQEPKWQYT